MLKVCRRVVCISFKSSALEIAPKALLMLDFIRYYWIM